MNKRSLQNLTKDQLITLVSELNDKISHQDQKIKTIFQMMPKQQPVPAPRKSVKQMVQAYEDNIIQPPLEFRDDYKPVPKPRTKTPVPTPRTKIEQVAKAMTGYTKSFEIGVKNDKDPLRQLQNTRQAIENHINNILTSMKFVETLKVTFTKMSGSETIKLHSSIANLKPSSITQISLKRYNHQKSKS